MRGGFSNSMSSRIFLILIGGVILSALITVLFAARERQHVIAEARIARLGERVGELISLLNSVSPPDRANIVASRWRSRGTQFLGWKSNIEGVEDSTLTSALRTQLETSSVTARKPDPDVCIAAHDKSGARTPRETFPVEPPPPERLSPGPPPPTDCRIISLMLEDGTPLSLLVDERPPPLYLPPGTWMYWLFFLLCVAALAYQIARMTTRPLQQLAHAAIQLGDDLDRQPLDETRGPVEVQRAATAFNAMQSRIRAHIHERTQMLAAISHDLQTPLTRLRLRLEKVDDEILRARLVDDLRAMQGIINEGLELARSTTGHGKEERVDIDSLVSSVCADCVDAGMDVSVLGKIDGSVLASYTALKRCLNNIIENAVKYGQRARIFAARNTHHIYIIVEDDGPGIPEAELEKVFVPFYRLESSRSRETGGTGLGLSIARNIAERYGGTLVLRNIPNGGLEAKLSLPLAK